MTPFSTKFLLLLAPILLAGCLSRDAVFQNFTATGDFGLTVINASGSLLKVTSAKYAVMDGGPVNHEISTGDTSENHVEGNALSPGDTVYISRMSNNGWSMVVNVFAYDGEGRLVGRGQKLFQRPMDMRRLRYTWTVVGNDLHR